MIRGFGLLAAVAIAALPMAGARAQALKPNNAADAPRYTACMTLAQKDPKQAAAEAKSWADKGGGEPAQHCAAIAYLGMGLYSEAAHRLETLAERSVAQGGQLRAEMFAQAGQAWLIAGRSDKALAVQTRALELKPNDVEVLIDRSITLATAGQVWDALDDLNRALQLAPDRADALVFRASAYRSLDSLDLAETDIERANRLWPDSPEVLLERGSIRKQRGNLAGARADWLRVLTVSPNSPAGEQARRDLQSLDLKPRDSEIQRPKSRQTR
jgi:tetratricopeptide (TPR) repeat protein